MVYVKDVDLRRGLADGGQAAPAGVGQRRGHGGRPAHALVPARAADLHGEVRVARPDHGDLHRTRPGEAELVRRLERGIEVALGLRAVGRHRRARCGGGRGRGGGRRCQGRRGDTGAAAGGALAAPGVPVVQARGADVGRARRGGAACVALVVRRRGRSSSSGSTGVPRRRGRRAAGRAGRRRGHRPRRTVVAPRGVLPAVATSSAMRPSDTARITHQLGRPRATRERKPSVASGPPPHGTGTRYARVTPGALARSGAQAALAAVTAGVEGAAIASGQGGQLGHGVARGRDGRRGPGPRRVASPRGAGRSACGPAPPGRSPVGTSRTASRPCRDRAGRIGRPGPWTGRAGAAGDSGWRRAGRARRRGGPARTIPAATSQVVERSSPKNSSPSRHSPPRPHWSFPATVDQPREQGLHQHPADEGVGVGLAEQDPDQPGGLLALDPARGAPHVLDQVAGRGAGRRTASPVPRTSRARPGSRPATSRSDRTAAGERPIECHSAAIWSMRATRWLRGAVVGHGGSVGPRRSPDPSHRGRE